MRQSWALWAFSCEKVQFVTEQHDCHPSLTWKVLSRACVGINNRQVQMISEFWCHHHNIQWTLLLVCCHKIFLFCHLCKAPQLFPFTDRSVIGADVWNPSGFYDRCRRRAADCKFLLAIYSFFRAIDYFNRLLCRLLLFRRCSRSMHVNLNQTNRNKGFSLKLD